MFYQKFSFIYWEKVIHFMCFLCTNVRSIRSRQNEVRYISPIKETIQCSCSCIELILVKEVGIRLICKCEKCGHYLVIDDYMPMVDWSESITQTHKVTTA